MWYYRMHRATARRFGSFSSPITAGPEIVLFVFVIPGIISAIGYALWTWLFFSIRSGEPIFFSISVGVAALYIFACNRLEN